MSREPRESPEPPAGWQVWNEEPGSRLVLAFRPDVFDTEAFPAPCLPTIAVAPGRGPDQLPERRARQSGWYRALFLEPAVRIHAADATYDEWPDAVEGAHDIAARFVAGEIDYRGAYQQPREAYLAMLDELIAGGE